MNQLWIGIRRRRFVVFKLSLLAIVAAQAAVAAPSDRLHAFYYAWYANPQTDSGWSQWNHQVSLKEGGGKHYAPPEDIGANFYPAGGLYSSNSLDDTLKHMAQMKAAGVGVVAATWWGPDSFTDKALPVVFSAAEQTGLKVCFHIEPFSGRNAASVRDALKYLLGKYGEHPALYRDPAHGNRPWAYVYDSYLIPAKEWATILSAEGEQTIRGTSLDTVVIGLWVFQWDALAILKGGFDGIYTYFAIDGFRHGSTPKNWPELAQWSTKHGKIFVPCVAPGYDDTRIRPWNGKNQRDRENGAYYDRMFEAAIAVDPPAIAITSFNEWHEGTQIEPAVPKKIEGYTYLDYQERAPDWYLERTYYWLERWRKP